MPFSASIFDLYCIRYVWTIGTSAFSHCREKIMFLMFTFYDCTCSALKGAKIFWTMEECRYIYMFNTNPLILICAEQLFKNLAISCCKTANNVNKT